MLGTSMSASSVALRMLRIIPPPRDRDPYLSAQQPYDGARLAEADANLESVAPRVDVDAGDPERTFEERGLDGETVDADEDDRARGGPGVLWKARDVAEHVRDGQPQRAVRLAPDDLFDPGVVQAAEATEEIDVGVH